VRLTSLPETSHYLVELSKLGRGELENRNGDDPKTEVIVFHNFSRSAIWLLRVPFDFAHSQAFADHHNMMEVDPQRQCTILRIKRKRTEEPLDALGMSSPTIRIAHNCLNLFWCRSRGISFS
jgi:hypothetical protein